MVYRMDRKTRSVYLILKSWGNSLYGSVSKDTVKLDPASLKELDKPVKMTIASSVSHSGRLWNFISDFSEDEFYFVKGRGEDLTHATILSLQPSKELEPGNYTLTIGARYDNMTYNKIVNLQVK
jgi:hypothetical protein